MSEIPESLERLAQEFRKLPTIGRKTAQRLSLYMVNEDRESVLAFAQALVDVKDKIRPCRICGNITEGDICPICANPKRDHSLICVVEDVQNLLAIERSGSYHGLYHVLSGLISPMNQQGPDEVGIQKLADRLSEGERDPEKKVEEVILAISPTVEGETTMLFIADLLKDYPVKLSRIASGIPVGGDLEYYDTLTLSRALEDRRFME